MKLEEAREVRQFNEIGDVNRSLSEGWVLYKIISEQKPDGRILPVYILLRGA